MKKFILTVLVFGVCVTLASLLRAQNETQPQTCKDQETPVATVKHDLADTVNTVKKESLQDFESHFHQQSCTSRLSICLVMVNDLLGCLDKASHDAQSGKEQLAAIKTKEATYQKLKADLQKDTDTLKAAKDSKTAKADIEQFDFGK